MFDGLVNKITEKMGRSVKTTIEPIKTEMKKTVDSKVDLYSKILRFGVLLFLFIDGTKRVNKIVNNEPPVSPSQIIINNYVTRKEDEN